MQCPVCDVSYVQHITVTFIFEINKGDKNLEQHKIANSYNSQLDIGSVVQFTALDFA